MTQIQSDLIVLGLNKAAQASGNPQFIAEFLLKPDVDRIGIIKDWIIRERDTFANECNELLSQLGKER
jgi:hypothetical protein